MLGGVLTQTGMAPCPPPAHELPPAMAQIEVIEGRAGRICFRSVSADGRETVCCLALTLSRANRCAASPLLLANAVLHCRVIW